MHGSVCLVVFFFFQFMECQLCVGSTHPHTRAQVICAAALQSSWCQEQKQNSSTGLWKSKTGAVLATSSRLQPEVADGESCVGRDRSLRNAQSPVTAQFSFSKVPLRNKEL